jgi:hypothetical protein
LQANARSANIVRDHATILPDDATPKPDGIFGKDRLRNEPPTIAGAAAMDLWIEAMVRPETSIVSPTQL